MADTYSPKEFMRASRPEQFSDSVIVSEHALSRSLLEYHLGTLTSRNQDTEFERFAFEIAKRTICPNLKPQTGPTGGGDAKVDTETYPVASQLALSWVVGASNDSANERWGFAFSAKHDWQPKLKSDIKKIKETGRGYTKAFFVTNQPVSDKVASQIQDELSAKFGFDVRVLGRDWLLDSVFSLHLENLAIQTLGIELPQENNFKIGPGDLAKLDELKAKEQTIQEAILGGSENFEIVNKAIEAAQLSRELEKPRMEVDGQYERAARLAETYGSEHQKLVVAYQKAWTAYIWHEDFLLFDSLYDKVEHLACESGNACHLA